MQIILLESLKKIGKAGEVVTVKDGYANNFLIPQKKAIVANKANKKSLDSRITEINKKNEVKVSEAIKKQQSMENITIELSMECNEEDKLYGSITKKQISDHLIDLGHEVSPDMIVIDDIKSLGEFSSIVQIYEDIESQLKIIISKK
jgi:large subunit ribosomal protein L9